jgi:hypothetical protein
VDTHLRHVFAKFGTDEQAGGDLGVARSLGGHVCNVRLVGGYRRFRAAGVAMRLVSPRRSVGRVIALVGLDSLVVESTIQGTGKAVDYAARRPLRGGFVVEPGQVA